MYSSDVPEDASIDEIVLEMYGPLELLRQRMILNDLLLQAGVTLV